MSEHRWAGPRAAAAVVGALGVLALIATFSIRSARDGWALQGPRIGPLVVSVALIVLAAALLAKRDPEQARLAAQEAEAAEWRSPAALVALLLGYAALLSTLGYALATTAFVWLAAWLLGSERPVRDGIVAALLGTLTSLAFSRLLGVRLPEGPWGF